MPVDPFRDRGGPGGGSADLPVWVVAASAASAKAKASADYTCDGTDDHVEINQAIDAASVAGGGMVRLSEGTFHIASEVWLKSSVTLAGAGIGATLLDLVNSADCDVVGNVDRGPNAPGVTDITVRDLSIHGNAENQTKDNNTYDDFHHFAGVRFAGVTRGHIENVHAYNHVGYGVEVKWSHHVTVWRVEADENGDDGISVSDGATSSDLEITSGVHLYRCVTHHNGRSWHLNNGPAWTGSGIEVDDGPSDVTIEWCVIHSNRAAGISLHSHANRSSNLERITISRCLLYGNNTTNQLFAIGVRDRFSGASVLRDILIDRCTIYNDLGIEVEGDVRNVQIVGCLVDTTSVESFLLRDGYSGAVIADCIVSGSINADDASELIVREYGTDGAPLANSVAAATSPGLESSAGAAGSASRSDHQHGTPLPRVVVLVDDGSGGFVPLTDDDGLWVYGAMSGPKHG